MPGSDNTSAERSVVFGGFIPGTTRAMICAFMRDVLKVEFETGMSEDSYAPYARGSVDSARFADTNQLWASGRNFKEAQPSFAVQRIWVTVEKIAPERDSNKNQW